MNDHGTEASTLRIMRGQPDDVEIAALAAATAGLATANTVQPRSPQPPSVWSAPSAALRNTPSNRPLEVGPSAWWASGLPR